MDLACAPSFFFVSYPDVFETKDRKAPLRLAGIREQMDRVRTGHGGTSGSGKQASVSGWPEDTHET